MSKSATETEVRTKDNAAYGVPLHMPYPPSVNTELYQTSQKEVIYELIPA